MVDSTGGVITSLQDITAASLGCCDGAGSEWESRKSVAAAAAQRKVIIVADVGVDDAGGLMWCFSRPGGFDVLFVGASFGSHPDPRASPCVVV